MLRLAWQAGLSREEIAGLTWPQVDLTDSVLYLSDRTVPLEGDTLNCLRQGAMSGTPPCPTMW